MAIVTVDHTIVDLAAGTNVKKVTWENLTYDTVAGDGDDGDPVSLPDYPEVTVVIKGTFGVGGTCKFQGAMTETDADFLSLTDPQGNELSKGAAAIEAVTENPQFYRPKVTAGDADTDIDVIAIFRRASR